MSSTEKQYGGNRVMALNAANLPGTVFCDGPYCYEYIGLSDGGFKDLSAYWECVLFVKSASDEASITLSTGEHLSLNASAMIKNPSDLQVAVQKGSAGILVAGIKRGDDPSGDQLSGDQLSGVQATDVQITEADAHYKVTKPWGHELWINGDHPRYVLKEIFIKKGNKTSLQYHNFKEETNILFEGVAKLVYKDSSRENDEVTEQDLGAVQLSPVSSIHVTPKILHRLIAETDVLLYEVSTPYLDDVIRILDDSKRPDGRIHGEHGQA